ncbi:MAG: FtsX-like permease family protein [Bryobacteraceae bacterium]
MGIDRCASLRGRDFMDNELTARPGIATPAIVSQSLATAFWPGGDPIGKRLEIQGRPYEVIGVAGNVRSLIPSDQSDLVSYAPINLMNTGGSQLVLRHSGDARPLMQALRTVVREVDSALIVRPVILTAFVERQISRYASVWAPIAVTGAVALMLAVMGIYGVVGFTVNRRTQEIGVRMALGAQRGDVIRLIMKAGARPIVLGVVAGFVLAAPAAQLLRRTPFLFGMSAFDPIAYGAVAALLLVVGLAATFVPARRASRLDPLSALRQE